MSSTYILVRGLFQLSREITTITLGSLFATLNKYIHISTSYK